MKHLLINNSRSGKKNLIKQSKVISNFKQIFDVSEFCLHSLILKIVLIKCFVGSHALFLALVIFEEVSQSSPQLFQFYCFKIIFIEVSQFLKQFQQVHIVLSVPILPVLHPAPVYPQSSVLSPILIEFFFMILNSTLNSNYHA